MSLEAKKATAGDKKVALHTLGCRLNFSETDAIALGFKERGYEIVPFGNEADVTLINTCTVTNDADSSCRSLIRKAHKASPEGQTVVVGCYAQMDAPTIEKMEGVDLVLGTTEKFNVFKYLFEEQQNKTHIDLTHDFWPSYHNVSPSHTRAFLKIQDGCNYICSFCIIPFARGRSRALPPMEVFSQAEQLVKNGHKEIVLTGVNIGEYNSNTGEKLSSLVEMLSKLDGLKRLRLSSVEPNTYSVELLKALKDCPSFQPHFHIPLQSGNDEILKSMRRKYNSAEYLKVIENARAYFPNASFGADIICGYPGETDEQFKSTKKFIQDSPLTHLHVFPYSKRKNTTAAKKDNHLTKQLKRARVREMIDLGHAKLEKLCNHSIGKTDSVLFESIKEGTATGYTKNFIKFTTQNSNIKNNEIHSVKITGKTENKAALEGNIL